MSEQQSVNQLMESIKTVFDELYRAERSIKSRRE